MFSRSGTIAAKLSTEIPKKSGQPVYDFKLGALLVALKKNYSGTASEANFEAHHKYKLYKISDPPSSSFTLTSQDALKYYQQMYQIRRMEQECSNLYKSKLIRGFCHLYTGQEAVAVGIKAVMRKQDTCITAYRCHGWTHLCGVSAAGVIAELTGRVSGCSRGKGGSMHMYAENFYGGNGIVGAQVPLGAGLALAHKYKGDEGVCFTMYGDGAANQGQVFEAYNIAKLWNLPVIFVCENNKYGMGTATDRASACSDYYTRGQYIPGIWVDGMDILAVREVSQFAIDWVKNDKGPLVVETETYRYFGHSMSDPGISYRSREEVAEVRKTRDCIASFRSRLLDSKLATEDQLKDLEKRIKKEMHDFALQSSKDPIPGLEELSADIYHTNLHEYIRGNHPEQRLSHANIAPRK